MPEVSAPLRYGNCPYNEPFHPDEWTRVYFISSVSFRSLPPARARPFLFLLARLWSSFGRTVHPLRARLPRSFSRRAADELTRLRSSAFSVEFPERPNEYAIISASAPLRMFSRSTMLLRVIMLGLSNWGLFIGAMFSERRECTFVAANNVDGGNENWDVENEVGVLSGNECQVRSFEIEGTG